MIKLILNFIIAFLIFYAIFIVPKALFSIKFYKEYELLYNPDYKLSMGIGLMFFIPYYGSAKLMEMIGNNFLKYTSYIIGICSLGMCVNTIIFRFVLENPNAIYMLVSLWINIIVICLNIIFSVINCFCCAKSIQAEFSMIASLVPPIGYYFITNITHRYFVKNRDSLRGTFNEN